WITHQSVVHRGPLERRMQLQRRIEGFAGFAIPDELEADEQAAAADIPDVRVITEHFAQPRHEPLAAAAHLREQPVALDHLLDGERRRARGGMTEVGVAMLEKAAALAHGVDDPFLRENRSDGLVA